MVFDFSTADTSAIKVLIISDEKQIQAFLKDLLTGIGIPDIKLAQNLAECFNQLSHFQANLILIDLDMADGVKLARSIKRIYDKLPVIAMCHDLKPEFSDIAQMALCSVLIKPLSGRSLTRSLETMMREK